METFAYISEIFSSVQGEGIYVGVRQIFIRFAGCNLNCIYCDIPRARKPSKFALVENFAGERNFVKCNNPLKLTRVIEFVEKLNLVKHHSISLTGGEPLLQVDFLVNFLPVIKWQGLDLKIYLESNGTLPKKLSKVINPIDIVAMDIKLPNNLDGRSFFAKHQKFLEIASSKEVFVKIVITEKSEEKELIESLKTIKKVNPEIPLVLQPVSKDKDIKPPDLEKILKFQEISQNILKNVRVIPQVHKILKLK